MNKYTGIYRIADAWTIAVVHAQAGWYIPCTANLKNGTYHVQLSIYMVHTRVYKINNVYLSVYKVRPCTYKCMQSTDHVHTSALQ
jgi:hypothetical protein